MSPLFILIKKNTHRVTIFKVQKKMITTIQTHVSDMILGFFHMCQVVASTQNLRKAHYENGGDKITLRNGTLNTPTDNCRILLRLPRTNDSIAQVLTMNWLCNAYWYSQYILNIATWKSP